MIKSNVFKFGYFLSLFAFWGGLVMLVGFSIVFFYNYTPSRQNVPILELLYGGFIFFLLVGISGKRLWDAKIIVIDTEKRKIKTTNRFTRRTKVYDFGYFDGAVVINEPIRGGTARNYYLIKNRKVVEKISGFIYANQGELERGLQSINNLGMMRYSYRNAFRILFGVTLLHLKD
jgi:hypothetical protein